MERIPFKYHPNLYNDKILVRGSDQCQCCGRTVNEYIETAYAAVKLRCLCLACVSDGSAAQKYDAVFVKEAEPVSDPEKRDELFHRTPGYLAWQGEHWLACCDDYCEYLGMVGAAELDELGIKEAVLQDYASLPFSYPIETVRQYLRKDGIMTGYLFRCLHCGRYRLYVDTN